MTPKTLKFKVCAKAAKRYGPGRIEFKNLASAPSAEIVIYGEIGDSYYDPNSVAAADFKAGLDAIPSGRDITICINSPGGNVFDGFAIYNLTRAKRETNKITCRVDGLAASIASVIALAGNECQIAKTADMMIHPAWGVCMGNAADMQETAALLAKLSNQIAEVYSDYSGKPVDECAAAMEAETWMTGTEAVAFGLSDKLIDDPDKEPDEDPDDSKTNLSRRRVPVAMATTQPQAPKASGAIKGSMNKQEYIALLEQLGIPHDPNANEDALKVLVTGYKKPAPAPVAAAPAADAPKALTLADISAEVTRVNSITARVNQCAKDLKIPAASVDTALARALKDATYLAEIEAYTPRVVGAEPIANGQAGDLQKTITQEQYRNLKPHEAKSFFKAGGKLKD